MGLGCRVVGAVFETRYAVAGHANSHFETASSPTSEYLEFPRRTHSGTIRARRRFSGSSSCAACCTAAEC